MIELDNAIEFYRNKTGHTTEQEQEILRQMDEDKKSNPLSPENLDKNIVLLQNENILLKAQNQALADRTDFQEELIVELAMIVYP